MYRYEVRIHWDADDSIFVASVPELPGCITDGADRLEAVENIEMMMAGYVEMLQKSGKDVPVPLSERGKEA